MEHDHKTTAADVRGLLLAGRFDEAARELVQGAHEPCKQAIATYRNHLHAAVMLVDELVSADFDGDPARRSIAIRDLCRWSEQLRGNHSPGPAEPSIRNT